MTSTAAALPLDTLEFDALAELVNIGVSRAAASLRSMIGEQVLLSVPSVALITRAETAQLISQRESETLVAVRQSFDGDLKGRALLIFPEANSLELVRAVTGRGLPLEDIIELEQEALAETGNIMLNGCLSTIANMFQRSLTMSLPEIVRGSSADLFQVDDKSENDAALFLYINFLVKQHAIHGYLAMLMDLPSMAVLKVLLGQLIERLAGDAPASHVRD